MEGLFRQVRDRLRQEEPASPAWTAALLIVTLALFVASWSADPVVSIGIVVLVLFVHESGHFLGMRLFGYRNVRMFFIPFFGAAVSGRNESAPAWQESIVLLLGPLPGIVLGLGLYIALQPAQGTWAHDPAVMFVLLNAFNLLPIVPLDGGRLFEVLLFSRHPVLAVLFRLAAVAGLLLLGAGLGAWLLVALAVLLLLGTPLTYRQAALVNELRATHPEWPGDVGELSEDELRELFDATRKLVAPLEKPDALAKWVRLIHGQVVARRAGAGTVVGFLAVYGLGLVATAVFVVVYAITQPQPPAEDARAVMTAASDRA